MRRPRLANGVYLRSYADGRGRSWLLSRRSGRSRLVLDALQRLVVEQCDGARTVQAVARAASERWRRPLAARDVERALAPLVTAGAVLDSDDADEPALAPAGGLELGPTGELRLVAAEVGFDCDGRGGCCRLFDRQALGPDDAARILAAYGEEHTPGGLFADSAIVRERPDELSYNLTMVDGGCTLLEPDGRCGVHRRLGAAGKPLSCSLFPLRDVACGDELHVGVALECRCVVDFAGGPPITPAAEALAARRRAARVVERVAATVPLASQRRVARADYLTWRAAAAARLGDDAAAWALAEAAALLGGRARTLPEILAAVPSLVDDVIDWLRFEESQTAVLFAPTDLPRQLYAWGRAAAEQLRGGRSGAPVEGERLLAGQLLHTHALLRAPTVAVGLFTVALRVGLARAGAEVALARESLPLTAAEWLARVQGFGGVLDGRAALIEACLTA